MRNEKDADIKAAREADDKPKQKTSNEKRLVWKIMTEILRYIFVDHYVTATIATACIGFIIYAIQDELGWKPRMWGYIGAIVVANFLLISACVAIEKHIRERTAQNAEDSGPKINTPQTTQVASNVSTPPTPAGTPKFKIRRTMAVVLAGTNQLIFKLDASGNSPRVSPLARFVQGNSLLFSAKDGVVYVHATITNMARQAQVQGLDIIDPPPDWDINQDDTALEVVDEMGHPVFQLETLNDVGLRVSGCFVSDKKELSVIGPSDFVPNSDPEDAKEVLATLQPLFKYPSSRFDGQRAERVEKPRPSTTEAAHIAKTTIASSGIQTEPPRYPFSQIKPDKFYNITLKNSAYRQAFGWTRMESGKIILDTYKGVSNGTIAQLIELSVARIAVDGGGAEVLNPTPKQAYEFIIEHRDRRNLDVTIFIR